MAISEVREGAAEVETVLDGRSVVHRSEVVLLDRQDHQLLQDLVAHHELLGRTRDVSVVVKDSQAGETGDQHLNCDVSGQVSEDLSLLSGVHTGVKGRCSVVETLVPDLENHI